MAVRERVAHRIDEEVHLVRDVVAQSAALLDERRREGAAFPAARLRPERRGDGDGRDARSSASRMIFWSCGRMLIRDDSALRREGLCLGCLV